MASASKTIDFSDPFLTGRSICSHGYSELGDAYDTVDFTGPYTK